MNELKNEIGRPELLTAIKNSINDARFSAKKLAGVFSDNIQSLRFEESESVFLNLEQNIHDLECFLNFLSELKDGMTFFDDFGLPPDPISLQNSGLNLFHEMHSAMESRDWIMLSDLIEYELSPLLLKADEWFGALDEKLLEYKT